MLLSSLIYLKKNNQTLMLLRNKKKKDVHKNKWNGLGGKFEVGETPEDCAIRETYEESGLQIQKLQLQGLLSFPQFADGLDWFIFLFTSTQFTGELMENPPEGELHWIDNDKILNLNLWEGDRIFIPWVLEGRFFSAQFIYDKKDYKKHNVSFYPQFNT